MRIGIMLRSWDEAGGVGVYTHNITKELLCKDRENEYILFFRNPANLGTFSGYSNVKEKLILGKNKAYWDQVSIPAACRREKVDVIFHPKFTVPLMAPCKTVMTVHGADWFISDQSIYYSKWDVRYMRSIMPLYFRKCSAVISVSQETTDNFNRVLNLPPGKVETIYFGPARHFRRVVVREQLDEVRARYDLPERFILTLTKPKGDARKNLGQVFKAYADYHQRAENPIKLVVGGKDCHLYRQVYALPEDGYGRDVIFPGWIDQSDLPAVYSLADLYLYPSNLEAFPIPLTEAMACGTPILTSNVNGLKEIAGDAAVMVNPADTQAISNAILRILSDPVLRDELSEKGLQRASLFSWDKCTEKTLSLLGRVGMTSDIAS
jgi:glycosyltransferase involved in cell wall biosynthesis